MIAIDLNKQQELDADPKTMQQIDFTGNIQDGNTTMFFIIEEAKETISNFSEGTVKVFWTSSYDLATACYRNYFCFNIISI